MDKLIITVTCDSPMSYPSNPPNNSTPKALDTVAADYVRVGMEDNPFLTPGEYARNNAELVKKAVRIARDIGREIASPDEARAILEIEKRPPLVNT